MRLVMVGLDYKTAAMETRETFSPNADAVTRILQTIAENDLGGCVLLATCNRTELYISHHADVPPDGVELLCRAMDLDSEQYRRHFIERNERQAVEHLLRVAGGMESSVPGDDQIISQVRSAVEAARKAGTADSLLEALFRSAVAAGKKIKTKVSFAREGASVAGRAVEAAVRHLGGLSGKRILVIGNGVIGRLAAENLLAQNCLVRITLRDLRRQSEMPAGCECVDFGQRYAAMSGCDAVVSATASPHRTVTLAGAQGIERLPGLFIDLAVPRDIDPEVSGLNGAVLVNVDDMLSSETENENNKRQFDAANEIIAEEAKRFDLWRRNHPSQIRTGSGAPDFPIFINLRGVTVLLAGGGKVAARRAEKLLASGASVHVVSPELSPEMERLGERAGFHWTRDSYRRQYMDGATLAIAATDSRETNRQVGVDAKEQGILVSVADKKEECTFYFPAIARSEFLVAGIVSNNGDHTLVRKAAATLRREMEAIDEDYQGGKPGKRPGDCASAAGHIRHRIASS